MNRTGEYWFDFGRLDSAQSLARTKCVLEDFSNQQDFAKCF